MWILSVASVAWVLLSILSIKGRTAPGRRLGRQGTDALRGTAIVMITIHHAVTNCYGELPRYFAVFVPLGAFGTAIFFFLSGYGNALSMSSKLPSASISNNWHGGGVERMARSSGWKAPRFLSDCPLFLRAPVGGVRRPCSDGQPDRVFSAIP